MKDPNPFLPNAPYPYPMKSGGREKVYFQGEEKRCIFRG